ncbi:hypothetical protein Ancab_005625, partial [Ancistrocladus abbreviatus]
ENQGRLVASVLDRRLWLGKNLDREQRRTYTEAVQQEKGTRRDLTQQALDHKKLEFNVEQANLKCLKGAYVGRAQDVEAILLLQQRLRKYGFPHYTVRHMGGDLVLLSSSNAYSFQSMDTKDAIHLAKWVSEIRPWSF